jgi:hypothetical protein
MARFDRETGAGRGATAMESRHPEATRSDAREMRRRQHEEYGGFSWGACFFGWLVAIGMAAILSAILSAAGAAIGLTETSPE